jgi:hypothetical protein
MTNKYNRHQSVISRQSDSSEYDSTWSDRYNSEIEKGAVQSRKDNIFDELNSIMNGSKSKYSTVDAAVEDMKQRSGLTDYLKNISKQSQNEAGNKIVVAQSKEDTTPLAIHENPHVLQTLENIIKDTNGNSSLPAIISRLQAIHGNDVQDQSAWDDEKLLRLVSKMNLEMKANHPAAHQNFSNLGLRDRDMNSEVDPSNNDAFHGLLPNKS